MNKLSSLLAGAALAAALSPVMAQTGTVSAVPAAEVPDALQLVVRGGVNIEKRFDAASGLTGWVLKSPRNTEGSVVYTSADGKTLLVGTLFSAQGENLTEAHRTTHIPPPDFSQFWERVEKSTVVAEGAQGKDVRAVLYAFLDPNCIYCHYAWKALEPYHAAGVQVRWLPVGFLAADSMGKSAAILQAKDPVAALRAHEEGFDPSAGKRGITAVSPNEKTRAALEANQELMQDMGITGTPGFIWKDKDGTVRVKVGMPRLSEIAAMAGVPEQPQTDPALERFR